MTEFTESVLCNGVDTERSYSFVFICTVLYEDCELIWLGLILRDPFQQQSSQFPRRDGVGGHRRVGLDLELLYENRGQSVLKLLLLFGCELGCDSADLLQHRFSDSF